jgi:isopentenyl-diphosphate delta-isomerase
MRATTTITAPPRITAENVATLFPEVDTSLAREVFPSTTGDSAKDSDELAGYDEEQVRLMDEVCIVLDDDDKPIGSASKKACECLNSSLIFRVLPKTVY